MKKLIFCLIFLTGLVIFFPFQSKAQACLPGDADDNGQVNKQDLRFTLNHYLETRSDCADQNNDSTINSLDLAVVINNLGVSPTPTSAPPPAAKFFPYGFMAVISSGDIAAVSSNYNVNVVHCFACAENETEARTWLGYVESQGLNAVLEVTRQESRINQSYVNATREYSDILKFVYPDDECTAGEARQVADAYNTHWSGHPPIVSSPGTESESTAANYASFSDYLAINCYPNYGSPTRSRGRVTAGIEMALRACSGQCDAIANIDVFDHAEWNRPGYQMTPAELEADVYQALIAGAKGIFLYAYYYNYSWEPGISTKINQIGNQLLSPGNLGQVFLAPDVGQTIAMTVVSGPTESRRVNEFGHRGTYPSILYRQEEYAGHTYLFAVNIAQDSPPNRVQARFSNLPISSGQAEVLFEGRSVSVSGGRFTDTFDEYEVHIYKF